MKKVILILACLSICMLLAVPAFGAATLSGNSAAITDSGNGPGITNLGLSPNVSLRYSGIAGEHEMSSVNTKGTMEYGVYSASNQVFQKTKTPSSGAIAVTEFTTTNGDTVSGTGWTTMGGS